MISPWTFWDFQIPNFRQIDLLWQTPGVTPVYKKGDSVIFAVNDMFTDAELAPLFSAIDSHRDYAGRGDDDEAIDGIA